MVCKGLQATHLTFFKELQVSQGDGNPKAILNTQQLLFRPLDLDQASKRAHGQHGCTVMKHEDGGWGYGRKVCSRGLWVFSRCTGSS